MQISRDIIEARAFIFDLMSVSFAYPTRELYESLINGEYVHELRQKMARLPQGDRRNNRHANRHFALLDKLAAYPDTTQIDDYNIFEAEYIALFEHSSELTPLHLNAHLYSDGEPQPVPVFQRLSTQYRDFDIEMNSDRATEQPDHLIVQLEFLAYLHKLLLQEKDKRSLQKVCSGITDFCVELQWVKVWATQLQNRPLNDFYHPLAQLLVFMLDSVCDSPEELNVDDFENS